MRLIKSPQNSSKTPPTQLDLVDFISQLKKDAAADAQKNGLTPTTH